MSWEIIKKNMEEHNGRYVSNKNNNNKSKNNNVENYNKSKENYNNFKNTVINFAKVTATKTLWDKVQEKINPFYQNNGNKVNFASFDEAKKDYKSFIWDTVKETASNLGKSSEQNSMSSIQEGDISKLVRDDTGTFLKKIHENGKKDNMFVLTNIDKTKPTIDNTGTIFNKIQKLNNNNQDLQSENTVQSLANMDKKDRINQIRALTKNREEQGKINLKVEEFIQDKEIENEAKRINNDRSYRSSIEHILKGVPEEALNSVMKTTTSLASLAPEQNNKPIGASSTDSQLNVSKLLTKKYQKLNSKIDNNVVKTMSSVTGTIGQMVPSILANLAMPGSGNIVNAINVGSSEYQEALNEENNNKGKAFLTGTLKGTASYGIEKITGGNFLSKGSLDDIAKQTISSKLSSNFSKKVASKIYEFGGEALEENLENQVGYVIDKVINNKNITAEQWMNDFGETTKNTILTTAVLNMLGLGGDISNKIVEQEKNTKAKKIIKEVENIIHKENLKIDNKISLNNMTNFQQNTIQNQINPLKQQIINQENKASQNGNIGKIESESPITNNSIYFESASKYNLDINNNTVKGIYDLASKRGINVLYDDTAFSNSKQNAKWTVDSEGNRNVILNPNANTDTALQSVMIHELTHDIEGSNGYNKINELVLNKLKQSENYDNMMLDIANAYKNEYSNMSKEDFSKMIEQEAVADYLGENLGNQEFVNELVRSQDRNTIQKIMDWVKNKIVSLKNSVAGNQEANYWNNIKDNFERAYNQEYQRNNLSEKFSIQTDNNGNKYVRVDTDQNIFDSIDKKDYNKIAKMYMQDYLKGDTTLSVNDNANIGRRGINKYTNPQQDTRFFEEKMKLTPELKNVLNISEKVSIGTPTKATTKFPNWEYYKFNFELGGRNFEGLINIGIDKEGNKHFYEINKIHNTRNIECFIETKKYYG